MKNIAAFLASILLLALAGCSAGSVTVSSSTRLPAPATWPPTRTPTIRPTRPTSTATAQPAPTNAPRPMTTNTQQPVNTASALPGSLAYMNAFPVWDIHHMPTATAATAQTCPAAQPDPVRTPVFTTEGIWTEDGSKPASDEEVLQFLDTYGPTGLIGPGTGPGQSSYPWPVQRYQDLTHDGVPELVLAHFGSLRIYGCDSGTYRLLFDTEIGGYFAPAQIIDILDLNRNQVPELYLITNFRTQGGLDMDAFEWNGREFVGLLRENGDSWTGVNVAPGYLTFEDADQDGLSDVVVVSQIPIWELYYAGLPWREARWIFKWDGREFRYYREYLTPPEFRFQAVQDGDQATLAGDYDRALDFYQEAIFSDQLDSYSVEIREALREQWQARFIGQPTPGLPAPDPLEYPHLAAYAYYRILLIHTLRSDTEAAQVIYDTLAEKFPAGAPGAIYQELAEEFWRAYQSSQDVPQACTNAVEFAIYRMPELTHYLGNTDLSFDFGWQSIEYTKTTFCPF